MRGPHAALTRSARVVAGSVVAVATTPDGAELATETLTVIDGEVTSWRRLRPAALSLPGVGGIF